MDRQPLNLVCCRGCGLVFLNPRWTKDGYKAFYAGEYDSSYARHSKTEIDRNATLARERSIAHLVQKRISDVRPRTFDSILDIGAGYGGLLSALRAQIGSGSVATFAIEASDDGRASLEQFGTMLIERDAEAAWGGRLTTRPDLIVMRHVLEHMLDPLNVLQSIRSAVREDGVVYLAVPDNGHPAPTYSMRAHWLRVAHTYYFTRESLLYLCHAAGLHSISDGADHGELWCVLVPGPNKISAPPALYRSQRSVTKRALRLDFIEPKRFMALLRLRMQGMNKSAT